MPTFGYNENIPATGNNPSSDQPIMQSNALSIKNIIGVDHFTFGTGLDGTHQKVSLTDPTNIPGGVVLTLNTKVANGQNTLWAINSTTSPNGLPLFAGPALGSANGYSSIYGGIIFQWGSNTAVSGGSFASGSASGTVTFAAGIFPNACFTVYTVPFYNAGAGTPNGAGSVNVDTSTLTKVSFSWEFNSNSSKYTGFYWLAIGN